MIEVSVWYSAIKLTPSLPRAGHEPTGQADQAFTTF